MSQEGYSEPRLEIRPGESVLLSVAPDSRRDCAGSEAAEHARRRCLAALRTADGQSMTKGTTIATAFAATGFPCVGVERMAA